MTDNYEWDCGTHRLRLYRKSTGEIVGEVTEYKDAWVAYYVSFCVGSYMTKEQAKAAVEKYI